MGSIVSGAVGWVFGTLIHFAVGRVEDIVTWILPIYMTAQVLRRKETTKYNNYLSFWCISGLLFGIDYTLGIILQTFLLYRILRIGFLIWIFLDNAHYSVYLVNTFLTPVIDEHREVLRKTFNTLDENIDFATNEVSAKAREKLGNVVQQSQAQIMTGVINFASSASKSVASFVSNAEEHDNNNNNTSSQNTSETTDTTTTTTSSSSSENKSEKASSGETPSNTSELTNDTSDNKEVES